MSKKSKKKLSDKLNHRRQLTLDNMDYSLKRLDLLIISVSGAGIYACLETSKFLIEQKKDFLVAIAFPAILFLIAIIANLISQFTGYLSNKFDYYMCDKQIDCNGKKIDETSQEEINNLDGKSQLFDDITSHLNIASLALLIAGLFFLIVFYTNITF